MNQHWCAVIVLRIRGVLAVVRKSGICVYSLHTVSRMHAAPCLRLPGAAGSHCLGGWTQVACHPATRACCRCISRRCTRGGTWLMRRQSHCCVVPSTKLGARATQVTSPAVKPGNRGDCCTSFYSACTRALEHMPGGYMPDAMCRLRAPASMLLLLLLLLPTTTHRFYRLSSSCTGFCLSRHRYL